MKKCTNKKSATSKRKKTKPSSISTAANRDIFGFLSVLVQKLTSFESKLDMLVKYIQTPAAMPDKPKPAVVPPPEHLRRNRPMYKAICADCGVHCEVPFSPREDRQVYCRQCFARHKNKSI